MKTSPTGPVATTRMLSNMTSIEVLGHGLQIMMARRSTVRAGSLEFAQDLDDGALRRGIHAGERFVHEVELGLLRQRPREEDTLLLAA